MDKNGNTSFMKAVSAIVWKDLAAEIRGRELIVSMFVFSLLVVLIFNFALDLNPAQLRDIAAGIIWVTMAFAGTLGLNRSMGVERDGNAMDGLLMAPVDRTAIFFGKVISNIIFIGLVELIVLPLFSIFYNMNLFNPGMMITVFIGMTGYMVVGTLLANMSVQARTRDVLLQIMLLPVAFPLISAGVKASTLFLQGQDMEYIWPSLNLMIAFTVVYIGGGIMFYDAIVEE